MSFAFLSELYALFREGAHISVESNNGNRKFKQGLMAGSVSTWDSCIPCQNASSNPASLLSIQFPANMTGKSMDNYPNAWVPVACVGELHGTPDSLLKPDAALDVVVWRSEFLGRQCLFVFLSLPPSPSFCPCAFQRNKGKLFCMCSQEACFPWKIHNIEFPLSSDCCNQACIFFSHKASSSERWANLIVKYQSLHQIIHMDRKLLVLM